MILLLPPTLSFLNKTRIHRDLRGTVRTVSDDPEAEGIFLQSYIELKERGQFVTIWWNLGLGTMF